MRYILIAVVLLSGSLSAIAAFAREWHFDVSVDGLPIGMHDLGKESIDVRGTSRAASHYRIDTERNRIEVWYSPEGEWLGLRSTTRNGHVLFYRQR